MSLPIPPDDPSYGLSVPLTRTSRLVASFLKCLGNLPQALALTIELADQGQSHLLLLVWSQFTMGGPEAIGGRPEREPAPVCLLPPALAKSGGDHGPFQLTEHTYHLPECRPHWVVRIVLRDLSQVGRKHLTPGSPDSSQDGLLDRQIEGQPIKTGHHEPADPAASVEVQGFWKGLALLDAVGPRDSFVSEYTDDPMVLGSSPGSDSPLLDFQPERHARPGYPPGLLLEP
jgi:hypothetical protein